MTIIGDTAGHTEVTECKLCGEDFDYLSASGLPVICEECKESQCAKCGGEGSQKLVGDETFWQCGDCKFIDGDK